MSWESTRKVIDRLRKDEELDSDIDIKDPSEHREEFQRLGLFICPSVVFEDKVISVGPPDFDHVKSEVQKISSKDKE
jgi:hypothetical protein